MAGTGGAVGEKPSVEEGGGVDRPAPTTESLPRTMTNLDWGKAACSEATIRSWIATDPFAPADLVEWRAPQTDERSPSPSATGDQFVIVSLTHLMCGLRLDASDFLVSVLAHYGIEWAHLTPNSITTLSIFAHLCEAYLGVAPTVEVFAHFYRLCHNKKGESPTLGAVFLQLRDEMKRKYPAFHLKAPQFLWTSLWFYAKLPPGCPLTFRAGALKEIRSWKDPLPLTPEQEKQVLRIGELSNQGLTGVDIVCDYLKHRISPLHRRAHLACKYTGPTDPTRDSPKDLSLGDIKNKLSYLLDLNKIGKMEPSDRRSAPASLVGASADERTSQHLGLLEDPLTHKGPASSGRCTRKSAGPRKFMLLSTHGIDSSPIQGHLKPGEEIVEATTPITAAASPNCGMEQKSMECTSEIEEGTGKELEPISSIIKAKRKSLATDSDSQRKAQRSVLTDAPNNSIICLNNGSVESVAALDLQSPGLARPSPTSSAKDGENSALLIGANVVSPNKVSEDSVSNVPLEQPVRGSPSKEVDDSQSKYKGVQSQKAVDESAAIPGPITEKITNEVILEKMRNAQNDFVSVVQVASTEFQQQADKVVMENQRLNDVRIMLEQKVKDLQDKGVLLIKEIAELKDENKVQEKMINELLNQYETKCDELKCAKAELAEVLKENEELQLSVSRTKELLIQAMRLCAVGWMKRTGT